MDYSKPHLSLQDQADQLIQRWLLADKKDLERRLADVSYYRLSFYWYPFRKIDPVSAVRMNDLQSDTSLDLIWDHYIFDRQLRFLLMDAIERIEVSIRTRLVYFLTESAGAFGYTFPTIVNDPSLHGDWIKRVRSCVKRSRKVSSCVKHFFQKYGDKHLDTPMWITAEVMDFGTMSGLFYCATNVIRKKVVGSLGIPAAILDTWLKCLNDVRNSCAHHEYIWCRTWVNKPKIPKNNALWNRSISIGHSSTFFCLKGTGTILVMCRYLLRVIASTSEWHIRVESLFARFKDKNIDYTKIGLPEAWQSHSLWK